MQCQSCGAINDEGSIYCISCGHKMGAAPESRQEVKSVAAEQPVVAKRRKIPWYVFALGGAFLVLMCVIVTGVVAFLLLRSGGGRIAYAVNYDWEVDAGLYLMDEDGQNVQLLVEIDPDEESIEYLAWSPDGKSIGYVIRDDSHDYTLWCVEVKTGETTRIARDLGDSPHPFDWSADSRQIVYDTWDEVIYLVNADGSQDNELTPGIAPFWSPDGDPIAYTLFGDSWDESSAMLINQDGSEKFTLREDRNTMYISYGWSPNGDWILVHMADEDEIHDIWLVSRDGDEEINLTDSRGDNDIMPSFSPDGRWIAYFSCEDDNDYDCDIYIIRKDGTDRKRLAMHMDENWLSWSPDSKALIYMTEDGEIERVEIDSGQKTTLVEADIYGEWPSYEP